MNNWTNFSLIIIAQLLFFIFTYLTHRKTMPKLSYGALLTYGFMGLLFGTIFDLIFGLYLGIYSYYLGFGPLFLFLNGLLSFGLMLATVSLYVKDNFFKFYIQLVCLGIVYESVNYFFPVWSWHFVNNSLLQELIVIFAAYFGLAFLMSLTIYLTTRVKFKYLSL